MDMNGCLPPLMKPQSNRIPSNSNTSNILSAQQKIKFEKEYAGNWIWRTISAYIDTREFHPSPKKIAPILGIRVEEVVDALEGLLDLGIIKRNENGYEKILKYVYFSDRHFDKQLILADHVLITTQILAQLDPLNKNRPSFYRTGFFATSHKAANAFKNKFDNLVKEFIEQSNKETSETVYSISLSCLEIINSQKEGQNDD